MKHRLLSKQGEWASCHRDSQPVKKGVLVEHILPLFNSNIEEEEE
jgi:hypothetical protein